MGVDVRMWVGWPETDNVDESSLAYDIAEAFGAHHFWIFRGQEYQRKAISKDERYVDTDSPMLAYFSELRPGRVWREVHIATRFYGPGYERGDLPLILAVARWLKSRVPTAVVMYSGDSGPESAFNEMTPEYESELWGHFSSVGHKPYATSWDVVDGIPYPECDLCQRTMLRHGIGNNYGAFSCPGCGHYAGTKDGGLTWYHKDPNK